MNKRLSILFATALISACQSKNVAELEVPNNSVSSVTPLSSGTRYQVKIGNQLDIFVLEDKTFNGSYTVRETGEIIIPQLGRIYVLGMSLPEVEASLKRELEATQLKVATVIADPSSSSNPSDKPLLGVSVRVSGRVMSPGRIMVPQLGGTPVSAYQAISEAGGLLPFADKKRTYILRNTGTNVMRLPVNLDKIENGTGTDVPLLEGDTIVVPQKVLF